MPADPMRTAMQIIAQIWVEHQTIMRLEVVAVEVHQIQVCQENGNKSIEKMEIIAIDICVFANDK